jgi:hypothetical protein
MGLVGSLDKHSMSYVSEMDQIGMGAPGGVEPPTNGLGNRCSIQLSYGAVRSHYLILLTADESLFQLREAHASTKHNRD